MSRIAHGFTRAVAAVALLAPAAGAQPRGHAPPMMPAPRPTPPPAPAPPAGPGVARGQPQLLGPLVPSTPRWPGTVPGWGYWSGPGWGRPGRPPGVRPPHHRPIHPAVIVSPWYGYGYYAPYYSSVYYGDYGVGLADSNLAPSGPEGDAWADRGARPPRTRVIEAGGAVDASSLVAEPLSGGALVRVRWTADGAQPITLVVADGQRRVLAAQTFSGPPYSAVFDGGGRIAFVGATVVGADGVSTTTLVPLGLATSRR